MRPTVRIVVLAVALALVVAPVEAQIPWWRIFFPAAQAVPSEPVTCDQTAADATEAAVETAIAAASEGDVVCVPAGTETWAGSVSVAAENITLRGEACTLGTLDGKGALPTSCPTVITCEDNCVTGGASSSRVTNFEFIVSGSADNLVLMNGQGWRVDTIRCVSADFAVCVLASGANQAAQVTGLIDHIVGYNMRTLVLGGGAVDLIGDASERWALPSAIGTDDAVYIEDSAFYNEGGTSGLVNAIDCNYGGAYVFRYNYVHGSAIEAHSAYGDSRGCRSWEIYENDQYTYETRIITDPFRLRGGAGVIFNNRLHGAIGSGTPRWGNARIAADNRRSHESGGSDLGYCNGSHPADGNALGSGWLCRDQIGAGADASAWTVLGSPPAQDTEPVYEWNNLRMDTEADFDILRVNGMTTTVSAGTGTTTSATLAACDNLSVGAAITLVIASVTTYRTVLTMPGGCAITFAATASAPPDGSTVQGMSTIHIISGRDFITDTEKPGYTAYTYPHPLQGS